MTATGNPGPQPTSPGDPALDELAKFRAAWKAEVEQKRSGAQHKSSLRPSGQTQAVSNVESSAGDNVGGASGSGAPGAEDVKAKGRPRPSVSIDDDEAEELARFREAWKTEVKKRGGALALAHEAGIPIAPLVPGPSNQTISGPPSATSNGTGMTTIPPTLASAIQIYARAVQYEQQGQLDEATKLYRQAFRMDSNVNRAYDRAEKAGQIKAVAAQAQVPPLGKGHHKVPSGTVTIDEVTHQIKSLDIQAPPDTYAKVPTILPIKTRANADSLITGTLATILSSFPPSVDFEPEDEKEKVHLKKIPDEVLVGILRCLDYVGVERFAGVCKKGRLVSLDSAIWRDFVQTIYKPPQIPDEVYLDGVVEDYMYDYRRVFVEQPRIRFDGVYIAVCHYVRRGLSQDAWVNISHLITYHRYLRFFPNGQVLSLLANEEMEPQQVIPLLKPSLRKKGFSIGSWALSGTTVYITDLVDPSSLPPLPSHSHSHSHHHNHIHNTDRERRTLRYVFQMTLTLRSRPMGRWNKLEINAYETVDIEDGEVCALPLKHERPFWFSKVRSWAGV